MFASAKIHTYSIVALLMLVLSAPLYSMSVPTTTLFKNLNVNETTIPTEYVTLARQGVKAVYLLGAAAGLMLFCNGLRTVNKLRLQHHQE